MSRPSSDERPRILVVDDQPTNIQTLYQVLKGDYDVAMATNGSQAIELCQRRPPVWCCSTWSCRVSMVSRSAGA